MDRGSVIPDTLYVEVLWIFREDGSKVRESSWDLYLSGCSMSVVTPVGIEKKKRRKEERKKRRKERRRKRKEEIDEDDKNYEGNEKE